MSDFQVALYNVHLTPNGQHGTGDGTQVKFRGYIEIGGTKGGSQKEVKIFFIAKDSPVPKKAGYRFSGVDWLYVPIEEMPVYIDILRNEKPVYIKVDINDAANTQIVTAWEDAGEGE